MTDDVLARTAEATPPPVPRRARSERELIQAQLAGLTAYHRMRQCEDARAAQAREAQNPSREQEVEHARRREAHQREREALTARSQHHLERSAHPLTLTVPFSGLIAHRSDWMRSKLEAGLREHEVPLVGKTDDGADVCGMAIAEQPDLLIIEDLLPSMTGLQVLERVRTCAPDTLIAVLASHGRKVGELLEAGASAVFTRRIPPHDVVSALMGILEGRLGLPVVQV